MAEWSANGARVLSGVVSLPRVGNWHADLALDTGDASNLQGAITLATADGALTLAGTAYRVGAYLSSVRVLLVGGAGRLGAAVGAKYYQGASVTVGLVLGDLLTDSGPPATRERRAASAEAATLNVALPAWLRAAGKVSGALRALLEATDATWRVLPDGALWVGHETWPTAPTFAYDVLANYKDLARIEIASDTLPLLPGTNFPDAAGAARNVSYVEHRVAEDHTRTAVWFERAS